MGLTVVSEGADPGTFVAGSGNFPTAELGIVPVTFGPGLFSMPAFSGEKLVREFAGMAHPTIQTIVELASGRDSFTGAEIGDRRAGVGAGADRLSGALPEAALVSGRRRPGRLGSGRGHGAWSTGRATSARTIGAGCRWPPT